MDTSDSDEEYTIYVEFKDNVNIEKYRSVHVLGVNGKHPVVQMDDTFFTGKFENPLGTYMFFEEDPAPLCADPLFDKIPEKNLKYMCKTRKYLPMESAYVTPKEGKENNLHSQVHKPEDEMEEPVNFKTLQEAVDKFQSHMNASGASVSNTIQSN